MAQDNAALADESESASAGAQENITVLVKRNTKSPLYHGVPLCAYCGSAETQVGFDEITCRRCGRQTSLVDGHLVPLREQFTPCNK